MATVYELTPDTAKQIEIAFCTVCPHQCGLKRGEIGTCGLRANSDGMIMPIIPEKMTVQAIPAEHCFLSGFKAGMTFLAIEPALQSSITTDSCSMTPTALVDYIRNYVAKDGCSCDGVLFTGNDPFLLPEYLIDASKMLHREGIFVAARTNGFVNGKIARSLASCLDSCIIKTVNFPFCMEQEIDSVYTVISALYEKNVHTEVTISIPHEEKSEDKTSFAKYFETFARRVAIINPAIPIFVLKETA